MMLTMPRHQKTTLQKDQAPKRKRNNTQPEANIVLPVFIG